MANIFFYFVLFVGFFLPTNSNMYMPLSGALLKVNEFAFLLLPILNRFCKSKAPRFTINRQLKRYILLYLFIVLLIEFFFKPFVFGQSLLDSLKGFRLGLPLYSSLIILYHGLRADIKKVWRILLWAIGFSVVISFLSIFIRLPIYYGMEGEDVLEFLSGRIMNSNSSFGIIGLYLLFKDKDKWYNRGKLVRYVSVLSVVALIVNFNRTYLALMVLEIVWLTYKTFSFKTLVKSVLYGSIFISSVILAYNKSPIIQNQVDKRILSIIQGSTSLQQSTIDNNRDQIYEGIQNKIKEGYWAIGLPYNEAIFYKKDKIFGGLRPMNITDTSPINIILRFGILTFIVISLIYLNMFKRTDSLLFKTTLFIYSLAALNLDALFRHNSVLFLIILYSITTLINEKSYTYR